MYQVFYDYLPSSKSTVQVANYDGFFFFMKLNILAELWPIQGNWFPSKPTQIIFSNIVTRYYKTDQNHTSGKITLTNSYTIILLVLNLSITQTWFYESSLLGDVASLNDSFWPCEGPGLTRISGWPDTVLLNC